MGASMELERRLNVGLIACLLITLEQALRIPGAPQRKRLERFLTK